MTTATEIVAHRALWSFVVLALLYLNVLDIIILPLNVLISLLLR